MGIPRGRLTLLTVNKHGIDLNCLGPILSTRLALQSERGILLILVEEKAMKRSMFSELAMISREYLLVINIVNVGLPSLKVE